MVKIKNEKASRCSSPVPILAASDDAVVIDAAAKFVQDIIEKAKNEASTKLNHETLELIGLAEPSKWNLPFEIIEHVSFFRARSFNCSVAQKTKQLHVSGALCPLEVLSVVRTVSLNLFLISILTHIFWNLHYILLEE